MIQLEIDGRNYIGWTRVMLTRSLGSITGSFELTFTDRYRNEDLTPIQAGKTCRIFRNDVLHKTGFIDSVEPSFDKNRVSLVVSGRDNPDLADCAVVSKTGEFKELKFEDVVTRLIAPFGRTIDNRVGDTGDVIPSVNYDQGTKVYELIRKYAEKKQLLIYSGLDARVVIDQASNDFASLSLVEGENILKGSGSINRTNLFSKYIIKGDRASTARDFSENETQAVAEFEDSTVGRNRPTIIISEGHTTNGTAQAYAQWEATTRLAQSESYSIEVQGWINEINKVINVDSPTLKLKNALQLIAGVALINDEAGERTVFALVPTNAFDPLPGDLIEADGNNSDWAARFGDF